MQHFALTGTLPWFLVEREKERERDGRGDWDTQRRFEREREGLRETEAEKLKEVEREGGSEIEKLSEREQMRENQKLRRRDWPRGTNRETHRERGLEREKLLRKKLRDWDSEEREWERLRETDYRWERIPITRPNLRLRKYLAICQTFEKLTNQ